jgi:hypothetical protein
MSKELIERLRDTASKGVSVWGDLQKDAADLIEAQKTKIALQKGLIDGLLIVKREIGNEREALAAELAAARAQVPAGSIRLLWDAQWVSIVNHDNAYNSWSTNDAVNHAVRMTERYIAANVAQNNLPPLPAAQEVK